MSQTLTLVCISDTHGSHRDFEVPNGDILLHAGDISGRGEWETIEDFNQWLGELPHRHKVVIAGNHDFCFEKEPEKARGMLTNCIYLQDEEVEIEGLRIYGSPWQPWFYDWAFNLQRGPEIRAKWELIPNGIDILVTHGPPKGHGDLTYVGKEQVGCEDLLKVIERIAPSYHVFGHIHEGYGTTNNGTTTFINASTCTLEYKPTNPPVVVSFTQSSSK